MFQASVPSIYICIHESTKIGIRTTVVSSQSGRETAKKHGDIGSEYRCLVLMLADITKCSKILQVIMCNMSAPVT